jgi:hypothetical protein
MDPMESGAILFESEKATSRSYGCFPKFIYMLIFKKKDFFEHVPRAKWDTIGACEYRYWLYMRTWLTGFQSGDVASLCISSPTISSISSFGTRNSMKHLPWNYYIMVKFLLTLPSTQDYSTHSIQQFNSKLCDHAKIHDHRNWSEILTWALSSEALMERTRALLMYLWFSRIAPALQVRQITDIMNCYSLQTTVVHRMIV